MTGDVSIRGGLRRGLVGLVLAAFGMLPAVSAAEPLKLPAGMTVDLELLHHVNSAYVPTGAPIYFVVAKDVLLDGQVLVRQGTVVVGKMELAQERGRIGKSGSMSLAVNQVAAVDGTTVGIDADVAKQGRSRTGATVAWTLFWGLPGLITQGVNPFMERGTSIAAQTVADVIIDPANALPAVQLPPPAALQASSKGYRLGRSRIDIIKFDIERDASIKPMTFDLTMPQGLVDPAATLLTLQLVAVDGQPVPVEVRATSSTADSVTFDGWSIVRFCRDGATALRFLGRTPDGQPFEVTPQVRVKVKKKA
jgi:hypothetical protein